MRRIAMVLGVALALAAAAPATAQKPVSAGLSGANDDQVVRDEVRLTARGSSAAGIRRLTMSIDGELVAELAPNGVRQEVDVPFDWDTTRYVTSDQSARNRTYEVTVRAVSNSGAEDEVTTDVIVDNAPSAPVGLTSGVEDNTITLRWTANPEPDILGYRIERFFGDGYVKAALVEGTEWSETRDPGQYSYRVIAIRHSEVSRAGLASEPSTSTTAAVAASAGTTLEERSGGHGNKGPGSRNFGKAVRIGAGGLPGGASLPMRGLSGLPDAPETLPWGSYEKRLPYKLPKGGIPIEAAPARSVNSAWTVVPPDGLRWVALGLLLMVAACFSRFLGWRMQIRETSAKLDA